MAKNFYWGDREEALCRQWNNTGNTQSDYTRIWNELHAPMYQCIESIMQRYFSIPVARQNDLKRDCMTEVYLKLKHFNPEKSKSFSYCGMIAKHYILETQVLQPQWKKHPQLVLTATGDYEEYRQPIDYGETFQIDYNDILKRFKTLKKEVVVRQGRVRKGDYFYKKRMSKYNNQIMILDLAGEFVEKFESADASSMADYIFLNSHSKLKKTSIVNYFRKMLGFNVTIRVNMNGRDKDSKIDNKYSFMEDDFTPNEAAWAKRQHRSKRKQLNPDTELYNYF